MSRVIEALALEALALDAQGDADGGLTCLARALSLAEPEGYVRVFADEGIPMARLFYRMAERGVCSEYVGSLLRAFGGYEVGDGAGVAGGKFASGGVEALSRREFEVLQLLAEGLSNKEIAGRLYLSPNTIKVHTQNIYGKLQVERRTQAVATARRLGLLS